LQERDVMCESFRCEDADFVLTGFGITSRILKSAVEALREKGHRAGLFRPITLMPFPVDELKALAARVRGFLCVELNNGQMLHDVRLAIECARPVHFYGRMGGNIPTTDEIVTAALNHFKEA